MRYYSKRCELDGTIDKFESGASKGRRRQLKRKMLAAMVLYQWNFEEFFLFDYEHLSNSERKAFVPEYEKNVFCDMVNDAKTADVFYDKWATYLSFRRFFGRDVIEIRDISDLQSDKVTNFLKSHSSFIVKPVSQACGRGIEILKSSPTKSAEEQLKTILEVNKGAYVLEELIVQNEIMASFHPQSVNTIRIPTIRVNEGAEIIHPYMRIGQGSAVVDNAGAGGIICNLNPQTGEVIAACDEAGHKFSVHPDTGKKIIGFIVPRWQEAVEKTKELADVLPNVKYVGWDLALTDNGWIMIEGNDKGQFVFQYPSHEGFRTEFESIKKRVKR